MTTYTMKDLERLPTLAVGQADDLKVDTGSIRVWLSRCGPEDGETQPIKVEKLDCGRWLDATDQMVRFPAPPVPTSLWDDASWFAYVAGHGLVYVGD